MLIKEEDYGSILYQCPEGPDKSKKQGDVQSDKKTADLFWSGGSHWSTVLLFAQNSRLLFIIVEPAIPFYFDWRNEYGCY